MRTGAPPIHRLSRMTRPAAMAVAVLLTVALIGCGLLPDSDSRQDHEDGPATQGGAATTFTQRSPDPSPSPATDSDDGTVDARAGYSDTPTPRPDRESAEEPAGVAEETPTPTPESTASTGASQSGSRDGAVSSASLSPEDETRVSPAAGRVVSGFIVSSETGAPVKGATVHVVPDGGSAVSDDSGFYRVSGVSAADHSVSVSHHGFEPARRLLDTSEETWNRADFDMTPRESAGAGEGYRVLGQVLDRSTGNYVPGAEIKLSDGDGRARNASAGAEGEYTFAGLPPGAYEVWVEGVGYRTYTAEITVDSNQARQFLLSPEYASVEGRVLLESPDEAVPIPGATVSVARDAEGAAAPVLDTTTGEDGRYSIPRLAPGRYRITASAVGLPEGESAISIGPGESAEADVLLETETSTLSVSLTSPAYGSMPVSGVTLKATPAHGAPSSFTVEAATGPDGVAALDGLPPGIYEVTTTDPTMTVGDTRAEFYSLAETVAIAPGESPSIQAELQPVPGHVYGWPREASPASRSQIAAVTRSASSEGEVSGDGDVGAVVAPGLQVSVSESSLGASDARAPAPTESDDLGNYSLSLPPGRHTLRVDSGDGPFAETSVSVSSGQHVKADLTLPPRSTAVAGHVKAPVIRDLTHDDEVVAPLSGARVTLSGPDDSYTAVTDGRGAFAFPEVALEMGSGEALPTEYALNIEHPEFADFEQTITLERTGGVRQLTRTMSDPESSGELRIRISYSEDGGSSETTTGGHLHRLKNLDSHASYPDDGPADTVVDIPDTEDGITLRARPGVYQARICPELPGKSPCYEHEWISDPGSDETLDLEFECDSDAIAIPCRPDDDAPVEIEGDIFAGGLVLDAQSGKPVQGANVQLFATADAEYCTEDDDCFTTPRDLKGSHATDETGRFRISLHVLFRNGPGEIVGWTMNDEARSLEVRAPGYETVTLSGDGNGIKGYASPFVVYLEPTGGIGGRVVSGTSERAAAGDRTWRDTDPVLDTAGEPARVSFAHAGTVKLTDEEGRFELPGQRADGELLIEAAGHYPYRSSEAFDDDASDEGYTFSLERIPGFSIQPGSFSINHPDGEPLEGYVLTGGQAPSVAAQWRVSVDRGADRRIRDGFSDPVQAVDLIGEVVESCGEAAGEPARVRFSGQPLEGEAGGSSTWGGPLELSNLPCGRIQWRVVA
ncbi:MAG: carboxypeptidase regulatory-like domain-containing protein, partial [Chloroflexota bacterium]